MTKREVQALLLLFGAFLWLLLIFSSLFVGQISFAFLAFVICIGCGMAAIHYLRLAQHEPVQETIQE